MGIVCTTSPPSSNGSVNLNSGSSSSGCSAAAAGSGETGGGDLARGGGSFDAGTGGDMGGGGRGGAARGVGRGVAGLEGGATSCAGGGCVCVVCVVAGTGFGGTEMSRSAGASACRASSSGELICASASRILRATAEEALCRGNAGRDSTIGADRLRLGTRSTKPSESSSKSS